MDGDSRPRQTGVFELIPAGRTMQGKLRQIAISGPHCVGRLFAAVWSPFEGPEQAGTDTEAKDAVP
ncbi:hypothetical protein ColTof4_12113 [Colletotrichum tofieldiae]|nr:hypothetical protein ColTof3_05526 [Colletotrichum tofieldiae]GKT79690.1 hypothetical protein ColTof4_12113 [Colletotrichum tofieldiae]